MECFWLLFDHLVWIEHQFLSCIRDSRKAGSLWGMMRGVGGVRKSIHQSWLAKRLGFKGIQQEIPSEEVSTLQIGPVAFPRGQCTSPQIHPCQKLFDQDGHQDSSSCRSETIEEMKESVTKVIDTLTHEVFYEAFQKLLERYNKCIAAGGDYLEGDLSFMCVLSIKVPIRKNSGNLFNDPRIYIYIYIYCNQYK